MHSDQQNHANVSGVSVRRKESFTNLHPDRKKVIRISDRLTRNFLCAALLVVCVYAVKTAQFPDAGVLETAARSITETPWEENLGRIQFVSHVFPETLSVFWGNIDKPDLTIKSVDSISHTWSQDEPYISIRVADGSAYVLSDGTVQTIAHDNDENMIVSVDHGNGYISTYYDLADCVLHEGDAVSTGDRIGKLTSTDEMIVEIQQDRLPIDPTLMITCMDTDV